MRALVSYNLWRRLAIGVAYNLFDITLEDKEWLRIGENARPEVRWGVIDSPDGSESVELSGN